MVSLISFSCQGCSRAFRAGVEEGIEIMEQLRDIHPAGYTDIYCQCRMVTVKRRCFRNTLSPWVKQTIVRTWKKRFWNMIMQMKIQ